MRIAVGIRVRVGFRETCVGLCVASSRVLVKKDAGYIPHFSHSIRVALVLIQDGSMRFRAGNLQVVTLCLASWVSW